MVFWSICLCLALPCLPLKCLVVSCFVSSRLVSSRLFSSQNWSGWLKLNKGATSSHSCEALPLYDSEVEAVNRVLKYNSNLHVCGYLKVNDIREFPKFVQNFLHRDAKRNFLLLRLRQPGGSALHTSNELWDQVVQNGTGRVGIVELGHLNGGKMYIVPPAKLVRARFPDTPIVTHFEQPGFDEDVAYGLAMWKVTSLDATRHGDILCTQSTARLRELHAAVEKGVKACLPTWTTTPASLGPTFQPLPLGHYYHHHHPSSGMVAMAPPPPLPPAPPTLDSLLDGILWDGDDVYQGPTLYLNPNPNP